VYVPLGGELIFLSSEPHIANALTSAERSEMSKETIYDWHDQIESISKLATIERSVK